MRRERGTPFELFVTVGTIAFEGLLARVQTEVSLEVVLFGKGLCTGGVGTDVSLGRASGRRRLGGGSGE